MEHVQPDPLHWMCRQPDPKQKFNLGEVYKSGVGHPNEADTASSVGTPQSCVDNHRKGLAFERKGPYAFQLYGPLEHEARCVAVDVFFEEPTTVAQIRFRNHYVAYLSVLMKLVGARKWQTVVQRRQLMPHPHCEKGSRGRFEVSPAVEHGSPCWSDVSEIRLVLQQPSSNWRRFYVENLAVYGERGPYVGEAAVYLTHLMQKTVEALRMERKNERKSSTSIPFHMGTHGYEIDKLHKF